MRFSILLIAVLISSTAISQIKTGHILSKSDNSPVPFANIYSKTSFSGTVTNEEGTYKLLKEFEDDSIIISHIGFKRGAFQSADFFKANNDTIYLEPEVTQLEDVVIFGGDPRELVKKAVKKISTNYPVTNTNISSHFRSTIQENNDYVIFLEGAFLIQNPSYLSGKRSLSKVQVLDIRASSNKSQIFDQFKVSPENIINASDFFKNKPFLSKDLNNYNFQLVKIVSYDNYEVYVIKFEPQSGLKRKYSFSGTVFIETKNLAFVKLEYSIAFSEKYSFIKNSGLRNEFKQTFLSDKYEILFKPTKTTWVVSYVRTETLSVAIFTESNKEVEINLTQELLASKSELTDIKIIEEKNAIDINENIYKHANSFDQGLWAKFNQIAPNEKLKYLIQDEKK